MKRTTVTLTDDQEQALELLGHPGPFKDAIRAWAAERGIDMSESPAEAAFLRLLIDAGIEHIRATAVDIGYAELAMVYEEEGLAAEIDVLTEDSLEPAGEAPA